MKLAEYVLFFLILITQQINIIYAAPSGFQDISTGYEDYITVNLGATNENKYYFQFNSARVTTNSILYLSCTTSKYLNPGYLYASFGPGISEASREFSSQNLGTNDLYINLKGYATNEAKELYILLKVPNKDASTEIKFKAKLIQNIELTQGNKKASFKLSHNSEVYLTVTNNLHSKIILIYSLGENLDYFKMTAKYETDSSDQEITGIKQIFENGYGVIIPPNTVSSEKKIIIKVTPTSSGTEERKVEVGFEIVNQGKSEKRRVNILEHVYGAIKDSQNCYQMSENINLNKHPVLLINAFSQAVSFIVNKNGAAEGEDKLYSQDGLHNSYIRLLEPFNNTNYFCIKKYKPKDKENDDLGESSYDFQLYYEDDLPNIQMFIMPLINGKIYTHSLNRGGVMVYRHSSYSNGASKIYSANLLKIRGNPKLYGYTCGSYPKCQVTKESFGLEEIERINQYYVNKRKEAEGNIAINAYGEPVSELSIQYMSVVICDTVESDPNYGECKYTIEINNEGDEIQLLPERVFTTSLFKGDTKFNVRISNYDTLKKLNITLTVLTGNAYMKVYSDKGLTNEATGYIHHKVFRREIYEFIKPEGDNFPFIKENYYGKITCTEPSFVELSYTTDFHFKGYIMTNPGEVNIQYINKKGSQFPYEIQNPYYYLPLDQNMDKNKDYMFKIRSKECSMFYNYNYNDMPNTYSVNMQFDRSQPYTYLTSFAFMTTLDNYNYNSIEPSVDCAMIVYSGEIDSPERPLLIVSDVALPSDFENTNFIYPYINNDGFNGIIVDIRFPEIDGENPSYKVTLSVKGNNVLPEKTISSDEIFYIEKTNNEIKCERNMQCVLKIQIQNTTAIDPNKPLTVNVYSPKPQIPEILDSTISSGKLYIPKDGYKITQTSIGQYEGTEFKFEFSSGNGKVEAKLVKKDKVKDINDYNNFHSIDSINDVISLNYDSLKKSLRIENAQTSICSGGCELLMKIQMDGAANGVNIASFTQKQIPLEITPTQTIKFNLYPLYEKMFTYTYNSVGDNNILYISVKPDQFAYPGFIYASFEENVSEDNRTFSSQDLGTNELYIDLSKYRGNNQKLYILVKAPKRDNGNGITFVSKLIKKIEITDNNPKAKFKLSHNSEVYYKVPDDITYNSILLYGLGEYWNFFEMKATYQTTGGSTRNLNVKHMFLNGYGVVVDLIKVGKGKEIKISLTPKSENNKERKVEVGFEIADQEVEYMRPVNILEHVYGATAFSENCYTITENVNINKHPVLLINAFSQAVSFVVRKSANHAKQYSQDGFHNSFIRLLDSFDETNYFCIKKFTPKDRLIEDLGESSYDFQLYYEDDLPNNQMYIMPLINGKIYTHSLNRGSVMVYRNSIFADYSDENENKIYSANLLKIRGNPKLYGYTCETYPYCTVTKDTPDLEEIERINLYYVNKRVNATGNNAIDPNGEAHSEIRKQYLSVVICDTEESDPNYGECKYTIEINNENDDIQLIPERMFATSLLPGINYFSVRISNYQDVKKLNISLTVLTGNAFMNVFLDYFDTMKITDYEYHKIFRREVFEFKSSSIREIYWGEINCTEPAFIEMTYTTDFHFKGYIMTNPGEVNIQYINKKGSQFPYEIQNPYYYLPLDQNMDKNKDYMFKIRSKECSMFYNYNYNDMPNTYSVNMQFDRSQPYTYLTSFAFMTTVDNYTYNTEDDSTDCAMLVYSGEIDSAERPLLIVSDYPLPSNFKNTYYVYPFISKDFKGLKIDIRFTDENIGFPSYNVILSVNGTNVLDEKTINKNAIISIDSKNNRMTCGDNIQCALKIQILKNTDSDRIYNLTVNVYSPSTKIPEIITPIENEVTKLYISKGETKTATISIGKNEETEIKFDFSSGTGVVLAKLLTKEEAKDLNNLIFDENSSNLIKYDALDRILRLTKDDTEKCDAGCDLVLIMSVEGTNEDVTEVSITKSPLINEPKEEVEQKEEINKGVEPWLTAVLVVVCVIAVSGILILIYFLVLRKKNVSNISRPIEESEKEMKSSDIIHKKRIIDFNN